jgi:hypothetical protein
MTITDSEIKNLIDCAIDLNIMCYDYSFPQKPSALLMCHMFEEAKRHNIFITDFIFSRYSKRFFLAEKTKEVGICKANIDELDVSTVLGFSVHYVEGFSEWDLNRNYIEYFKQKGGYINSKYTDIVLAYDKTTKEAILGLY